MDFNKILTFLKEKWFLVLGGAVVIYCVFFRGKRRRR
jgi:hypothetical protein